MREGERECIHMCEIMHIGVYLRSRLPLYTLSTGNDTEHNKMERRASIKEWGVLWSYRA